MAGIEVKRLKRGDTHEFTVTVKEGGDQTQHRVTLNQADYERLAGRKATPEDLVTASFRFLLEREPKESILQSFDLTAVSRYFPEYEREIKQRL